MRRQWIPGLLLQRPGFEASLQLAIVLTQTLSSKQVSVKSEDSLQLKSNDELCTAMHMKQTVNSTVDTQETSDSLLNGAAYDEESSAASFQEALAEWRAGDSKKLNTARGESASQTKGIHSLLCSWKTRN